VTATAFRFSADLGKLYENLVAITLQKERLAGGLEYYFWKSPRQEEVDFVVKLGLQVTELSQVCVNLDDPKTKEREVRALLKASKELKCKNLLILIERTDADEEAAWHDLHGTIRILPLWKWLDREAREIS